MKKTLPPILETLRTATVSEMHSVSFEGVISAISLDGIARASATLEQEWADEANPAPFRALVLRLLARLSVYNSLSGLPARPEFWEAVSTSANPTDRRSAILACNLSNDERLWSLLARAWREDDRGINRALALEMMGTTGRTDPQRRLRTLGEYRLALASGDAMATLGALHGSQFFKEHAAEEIPRRVIGQETNGQLVALAFTVLLARNPRRARTLFAAIVGYIVNRRPSAHAAAILLGVCALCDAGATQKLCHRVLAARPAPRLHSLRAGARYVLEHGAVHPRALPRRTAASGDWPVTP